MVVIEPISDDELRKLYMKKTKKELCEMVINLNKLMDMMTGKPKIYIHDEKTSN